MQHKEDIRARLHKDSVTLSALSKECIEQSVAMRKERDWRSLLSSIMTKATVSCPFYPFSSSIGFTYYQE